MKRTVRNLALFLCAIVVSLFMAEVIVRVFVPQQLIILRPDIWKPASTFGYRHHENANTTVNLGEQPVHFVTDSNGHRINRSTPPAHRTPEISILTIGDSFLEGLQVENEFTIPQVLERNLERKYHKSVQVDNAGVGGWNPNHYFLEAKQVLPKKVYDLGIIFLFTANDIKDKPRATSYLPRTYSSRHVFRIPQSLTRAEIIKSILYPFNDFFEERSHVFILFKTAAGVQLAKVGLTAVILPSVFDVRERGSLRWKTATVICEDIQREFYKFNTPVFFVLLPTAYQVYDSIFQEFRESFHIDPDTIDLIQASKLLKKEFLSRNLVLVDPLEHMKGKAEDGVQMYGSVDRHFNEEGHQVVSEYIFSTVESYLFDL